MRRLVDREKHFFNHQDTRVFSVYRPFVIRLQGADFAGSERTVHF